MTIYVYVHVDGEVAALQRETTTRVMLDYKTHTEWTQVGRDRFVADVRWLDDVGAVLDTIRVGSASTGVVQEEGVAPQQRPHYLVGNKTCKEGVKDQ